MSITPDQVGRVPALVEQRVDALEQRVDALISVVQSLTRSVLALEGLLTPEQQRERTLIQQAERVVEIARAEGQLEPPL